MTPAESKAFADRLAAIESKLDKVLKLLLAQSGGEVADDRDLDSEWGDPIVKYDLRDSDWQGPSMEGKRLSQCPVEWLDAKAKSDSSYAEYLRGPKKGAEDDLKKAAYREKDAARARGWAKRLRGGWRPAGAARPQGAPHRATAAASASAQAPGAARGGYGAGSAYGGGAGYGASGDAPEFGIPGGLAPDGDIPFISSAFDPHHVRRS